jgi:hypothetical protein
MVTMLQRSPTYIAALPNKDKVAAQNGEQHKR